MVHSLVNSAVILSLSQLVYVNLCHACKKSTNNTQNEVEHAEPYIHSTRTSCGPERRANL